MMLASLHLKMKNRITPGVKKAPVILTDADCFAVYRPINL